MDAGPRGGNGVSRYEKLCNLAYLDEATGVPYKTLDGWVRERGKLTPLVTPLIARGYLFDWNQARQEILIQVRARPDEIKHKPVEEWPV